MSIFRYCYSDDDYLEQKQDGENSNQRAQAASLLDTPPNVAAIEHKKGYMMRKCCYESNYKKSKKYHGIERCSIN